MRRKVAAVALCVAVAGAGAVAASQVSESGTAAATSDDNASGAVDTAGDDLQGCADSWNDRNTTKANVASVMTAAQQSENASAYVNVGFSAAFPDLCMITVANPSTMYVQQYVQEQGDGWSMTPAWTGTVSQLDTSNLRWNARMAQDGTIIIL